MEMQTIVLLVVAIVFFILCALFAFGLFDPFLKQMQEFFGGLNLGG